MLINKLIVLLAQRDLSGSPLMVAAAKLSTICFFPQQTGSLSHRETTQAQTGTSISIFRELSERDLLAIYLVEWLCAYAMYPVWVIIFSSVKSFIISDIKMKRKDARKRSIVHRHTWPRKARWKYYRSGTFHCKNIFVVCAYCTMDNYNSQNVSVCTVLQQS